MSDRSSFRGASSRGSGRGGGAASGGRGAYGYRQQRGGGAAHQPHQPQPQTQQEKPKKENILDLTKYMDKEVNVKFNGGRESMYFLYFFPIRVSLFLCF
jgi:U6 snRNA-associated Sm-like protein LSm7